MPSQTFASRCFRRVPIETVWILGATLLGVVIGLAVPGGDNGSDMGRLSSVLGWVYFCMWSLSFYPQVVDNFLRRSVVGLSIEYQLLNLLGFACYFAFNAALRWNATVRQEYADAHDGHQNAIRLNDVFFAGHATLITLVTLFQVWAFYDHPPLSGRERILRYAVVAAIAGLSILGVGFAAAIQATSQRYTSWLTYLLAVSYVKVAISFSKYLPQVWMNYKRKSTDGWSIHNVVLDFLGGFLSVFQLILDAWRLDDWSAVTGDPAKLLLGNFSMVFDVVFMIQHYVLYRVVKPRTPPLLPTPDA
eukprot:CAMPEP_0117608478 /NCGR_PEP_ID=MMETSP0784-20121206/80829_1 /TAXON_ID=39447 /ORGANISM="" /LENGTH=303 /DNA_ID=CAMNT_0005411753 /DNA_START=50 /DNA_END=961 /DNA_ORIENTATION=+